MKNHGQAVQISNGYVSKKNPLNPPSDSRDFDFSRDKSTPNLSAGMGDRNRDGGNPASDNEDRIRAVEDRFHFICYLTF